MLAHKARVLVAALAFFRRRTGVVDGIGGSVMGMGIRRRMADRAGGNCLPE